MSSAQGPLVTDWLSAIGQVVGAVATFAAVVVALAIAIKDNKRLAAEIRDREAVSARLITANLCRDFGLTYLEIRNDGASAVYNLDVAVTSSVAASYRVTGRKVEERNGRFVEVESMSEGVRVLLPHEVRRLAVEMDGAAATAEADSSATVTVRFTDAAGLQWVRPGNAPPFRELS
jgi:hypothetical protein